MCSIHVKLCSIKSCLISLEGIYVVFQTFSYIIYNSHQIVHIILYIECSGFLVVVFQAFYLKKHRNSIQIKTIEHSFFFSHKMEQTSSTFLGQAKNWPNKMLYVAC